jgi:hypothetical protein
MPVHFFTITTDESDSLVNSRNFPGLTKYLTKNSKEFDNLNESDKYDIENSDDKPQDRLYHILCGAIDTENLEVIEYFSDQIDLNESPPDGNAYDLAHLAIENYIESYSEKGNFDVVICLIAAHHKNHPDKPLDINARGLIGLANDYDDYELITILVTQYNVSLQDFFHYSIAWSYPKVFNKIVTDLHDFIHFDYIKSSLDIAHRFDNFKMIIHVVSSLRAMHRYEQIPKKYQFYIGEITFYEHNLFDYYTDYYNTRDSLFGVEQRMLCVLVQRKITTFYVATCILECVVIDNHKYYKSNQHHTQDYYLLENVLKIFRRMVFPSGYY